MQRNLNKQYFIIVLLLSLVIGITIHFPMVMNYLFGEEGGRSHKRFMVSFTHLGTKLLITFIVALLMFTLNFFILKPVEKLGKLKLSNIILAIVFTVISVFILNHFLYSIKDMIEFPGPRPRGHRDEFVYTNFFVSALVVGCVLIIRLIFQKQTVVLENEKLRRKALQSQFESLKNQLSAKNGGFDQFSLEIIHFTNNILTSI